MVLFYAVQNNILSFNNPGVSDAGKYTCRSQSDPSINATATLRVTGVLIINTIIIIHFITL